MTEDDRARILRAAQEEQARRLTQEAFRYYEPSVKGEEFINAVAGMHSSGARNFITLYSAANGIGKTVTGANIVANLMWQSGNAYFQHDLFTHWPFVKRGRIVSDPTNIEKNIIPTLKKWFPKGRYKTNKSNKKYESVWETDTGWEFDIMTYEQDPREFEGPTIGWIWLDEPPSEAILKACVSRTRKGGVIFITATPLAGSAYLYDMFAKGETVVEIEGPGGEKIQFTRPVTYIEADVWSACKDVPGTRGHLAREDILKMIAEYSEDERQARIYGKFQHLVGMVFKRWDRKIHVIKPFPITERDFCVYEALDPHPRTPDACMWLAVDKNGTKFVVDELWIKPQGDSELAERIKRKRSQYRLIRAVGDPSMFIEDQHTGKSLATRLSAFGVSYVEATKARAMSDRRIQDALAYTQSGDYMVKAPEVFVFDTCERTIWEIEHYRWDEWSGLTADKKGLKEKPIDKDDHMIEDLGRLLYQEPAFVPLPPRQAPPPVSFDTYGVDTSGYGGEVSDGYGG